MGIKKPSPLSGRFVEINFLQPTLSPYLSGLTGPFLKVIIFKHKSKNAVKWINSKNAFEKVEML
jgi:hypothetical protein